MPALTPAERQQRRRDKLAAAHPPRADAIRSPIETRMTRQEAWDEACDRLASLLETYRAWKLVTPTAAEDLSTAALPGLASQVLTLSLTTLALDWGSGWYLPARPGPGRRPAAAAGPLAARTGARRAPAERRKRAAQHARTRRPGARLVGRNDPRSARPLAAHGELRRTGGRLPRAARNDRRHLRRRATIFLRERRPSRRAAPPVGSPCSPVPRTVGRLSDMLPTCPTGG